MEPEPRRERPRFVRGDAWALGLVLLAVVGGLAFYPVYHWLDPLEAMRARWRSDPPLLDRLNSYTAEPMWSDGRGGALPAGYPSNQGGKDTSENMALFEAKLGGFSGRRAGTPAPDERWSALPSVPVDVWGRPYWLTVSWRAHRRALVSSGPDGQIGTADDLELFAWELMGWSMYWPMRIDALVYLGAGLFAWMYLVLRALALPRMTLPWEIARGAILVSPVFLGSSCCVAGTGLSVPTWGELQIAPAWLSVSLTLSALCVGAIVWRRTRAAD